MDIEERARIRTFAIDLINLYRIEKERAEDRARRELGIYRRKL